jgi:tetratricopeptide (TPR) repeat protein
VLSTLLVAACAAAFLYRHWPRERRHERRAAPLAQAFVLLARDQPEAAIDVLDAVDTRTLAPSVLAQWLNLKANALALAARSDEALDLLDDLQSIADEKDAVMQLCIVGNRGLAHLRAGQLELAAQLLDDTETQAKALATPAPEFARESLAETWYWRAELADKQGDAARRKQCLEQAVAAGGQLYTKKAEAALQKL